MSRVSISLALLASLVAIGCSSGSISQPGEPGAAGQPGAQGPQGPEGPAGPGATVDPSVSAVTPVRAFLARTTTVTISGDDTKWNDTSTVDFGAGVKVDKLVAASPTALVATITIAPEAAVGARDVKVKTGESTQVFAKAFTVASPIEVVGTQGAIAQGSIAFVTVKNLDLSTPFDTTVSGGRPVGVLGGVIGGGASVVVGTVTPFRADLQINFDVDIAAGDKILVLQSGPQGQEVLNPLPAALKVAARTATALAGSVDVSLGMGLASSLLKVEPGTGTRIVDFGVAVKDASPPAGAAPRAFLLPKSGKFSDLIDQLSATAPRTLVTKGNDPFYLVAFDLPRAAAYQATVRGVVTEATLVSKAADAGDTPLNPQTVTTLPAVFEPVTLATKDNALFLEVSVPEAAVGKRLRAAIFASADSDPLTLVDIDVRDADGKLIVQRAAPSVLTTAFTAAGVAKVAVFPRAAAAGVPGFDPAHNKFEMYLRFE
jgi:hypothetical protein